MVLLAHGALGGWDELAVVVIGFVVLWVAVKLAGRKPATTDDAAPPDDLAEATVEEPETVPSAAPRP
jgi:divalent metal cation (Fe/Co/Zn/Cd) transporter